MDNKTILLGVLQSHAPNGAAQEFCARMVREWEEQGATPREIEKGLIYALADGLNYGNWPWV